MKFIEKYQQRVASTGGSLLSVGLDSDISRLPNRFLEQPNPQFAFNRWIIEQTHQYVSAYKLNLAFYEMRGAEGWADLQQTMQFLRKHQPQIVTIADAKRADIGSSNAAYARAILDELGFDAMTLHPYLGQEALEPFLSRADKGCIILCRTSNPGAGELQDLAVGLESTPLWQVVAQKVRDSWNQNNNCLLVAGATYPEELGVLRAICGDMTFLVPGVGAQGGSLEKVLQVGKNTEGMGLIINSSRGVIFSDNPGAEAEQLAAFMINQSN